MDFVVAECPRGVIVDQRKDYLPKLWLYKSDFPVNVLSELLSSSLIRYHYRHLCKIQRGLKTWHMLFNRVVCTCSGRTADFWDFIINAENGLCVVNLCVDVSWTEM
jgi:hypothetical protein